MTLFGLDVRRRVDAYLSVPECHRVREYFHIRFSSIHQLAIPDV